MYFIKRIVLLNIFLIEFFTPVPGHCSNSTSLVDKLVLEVSSQTIGFLHNTTGIHKIFFVDFTDLDGKIVVFGRYLVRKLQAEVGKTKDIVVLERSGIERILEEQKLSLSGAINPEQAQQIGKLYGAQYIVTGILTDIGNQLDVTLSIVSVETGEIIGSPSSKIKMTPELSKLVTTIIDKEKSKEIKLQTKQQVEEFKAKRKQRSKNVKNLVACGMQQKQVLEILGEPDFKDLSNSYMYYDAWIYGETWVFFSGKLVEGLVISKSPSLGGVLRSQGEEFCP